MNRSTVCREARVLRRAARGLRRPALFALVALSAAVFFFPVLWTFTSSLKDWWEVDKFPPTLMPERFLWENYARVFTEVPFFRWIRNSLLIGVLATAGRVLTASLVGYGFSRFRWPGRNIIFMVLMGTMMLPDQVTLIPRYILFAKLHWIDTYLPLIVPVWFGGGPFYIFLIRQFFMGLPRDMDEAAMIDGAGPFRIFWQVLMPLCVPVLMTMTVISFVHTWNDFMGPLIYLNTTEKWTVPLGITWFSTEEVSFMMDQKPTSQLVMAAAVVAAVPAILVYVFAQRYFVRGVAMSGIKG